MVKLKKIKNENNEIFCEFYPEDSMKAGYITCNKNGEIIDLVMPKGYEWCKNHVTHAKTYLLSLFDTNDLPKEKTIMWN